MEGGGDFFPAVHTDGTQMAAPASTAHTLLDYDCLMPIFSVQQEAAAIVRGRISRMGNVNNPEILLPGTPADAYRMAWEALEAGVNAVFLSPSPPQLTFSVRTMP